MTIVKQCDDIEKWLDEHSDEWEEMSDREYRRLVKRWRQNFERILCDDEYIAQGKKAMTLAEDMLPLDCHLFSIPGYKHLPVGTSVHRSTHGYACIGLSHIDRHVCNAYDLILIDTDDTYCCVYTHEWQGFGAPKFYQRDQMEYRWDGS
jgi:hypothetical protein